MYGWGNYENPATWQEIAVEKPLKEEDEDDQRYTEVPHEEEAAEAEKECPRGPGRRPGFQEPPAMECLQQMKVIDAPDQVSKLQEFIKNAQGAALSRGIDMQPAVAALSRETALVEEERRRLEEERKGLEAERAEHQRLLDKYRPLLPLEAEMQTELEEARKERSELNTKLRQVRRTQNKLEASITFYDKLREKNRNEPCIYCQQPSGDRDSRRVCGACVLETEEAQRAFEAQHPEVELA